MSAVSVLVLALLLELVMGEPPARFHPVMWMGRCISALEAAAPTTHRRLYGVFSVLLTTSLFTALGLVVQQLSASHVPALSVVGTLAAAYLLKCTFAVRSLADAGEKIRAPLAKGDVGRARCALSGVVSRDTSSLDEEHVASAAVESISENYVDTVVSPLFYYVVLSPLGLSLVGALVFKTVSTFDSRWGYRNERYGEMGWLGARLDDVLNFVPARLSVPLIMVSGMSVDRAKRALTAALSEHASTPSPNSGWSMGAYAGALGVRLEKPNVYVLCPDMRMPTSEDITGSIRLTYVASVALFAVSLVILLLFELLKRKAFIG